MKHPHAEMLIAIADGTKLECREIGATGWQTPADESFVNPLTRPELEWRVKPPKQKFIKIGERWVPEPMRVAPEMGTEFWTASGYQTLLYAWNGADYQNQYLTLAAGSCHATREAAQQHLDALIELNNQSGVER